jgi:hypothetical protein
MFERKLACLAVVLSAVAPAAGPAIGDDLSSAIEGAKPIFNVRLRYEFVDEAGFSENADAVTVGARLGFETGAYHGLKLLLEAEHVGDLVDDYNSTTNGRVAFPVVADPESTEINRAQLTFSGIKGSAVVLGRQRIIWGDHRFVGNVGFRQNEQTFDALSFSSTAIENVAVRYAYIDRVQRILGDDHPLGDFESDSHIAEVVVKTPIGEIAGYGHLLDFSNAPGSSSRTFGARLSGPLPGVGEVALRYLAEGAQQSDYGSNSADFDVGFVRGEISGSRGVLNGRIGSEWLEGDGIVGFSTPLATLHKFQGWADAFLTTPAVGVRDAFLEAGAAWTPGGRKVAAAVSLHDFASDNGRLDLGEEVDAVASLTVNDRFSVEVKAAGFDGGESGPADRTKFWLSTSFAF